MSAPSSPQSIEALISSVLELSVPLHPAIAALDEQAASYTLAGPPGVAFFQRDEHDTISHESSSPSPEMLPVLDDLTRRHLDAVGLGETAHNSHVPALLLLCIALVDERATARFGLHTLARKPAEIEALTEDEGRHDPELAPHDAALRAWVPLEAGHAPEAGVHQAVLEFRFRMQRKPRYAPW